MGNIDLDIIANINGNNLGDGECSIEIKKENIPNNCFIQNVHSKLFLKDEDGKVIQTKLDIEDSTQRWEIFKIENSGIYIKNSATGRVISLEIEGTEEGIKINTQMFQSKTSQQWKLIRYEKPVSDGFQIINIYSEKVIDNHRNTNRSGIQMSQFKRDLDLSQLFRFIEF